jgi:serine/threonine-protein kinase
MLGRVVLEKNIGKVAIKGELLQVLERFDHGDSRTNKGWPGFQKRTRVADRPPPNHRTRGKRLFSIFISNSLPFTPAIAAPLRRTAREVILSYDDLMLTVGSRLGPYEVLASLGAGGMGEVWRARDQRLQRDVAIKVLPEDMVANPIARERFEREARAVAALSHPNILAIHDFGHENGTAYAVMELLEGATLRERLQHADITAARALEWAHQIAQGLAAAHERGIVHRDLKPDNIFVTRDAVVKVLDFGLARMDEPAELDSDDRTTAIWRTSPGMVMGTVGYLAPEQARGEIADARSDIFSFGVVFYEMLAGKPAFLRSSNMDTIVAILREEPKPLADTGRSVPGEVEEIVRHCLEKSPDDRFRSARDLAFALRLAMRSGSASGADLVGRHTPRPDESTRPGEVSIVVLPFRNIGPAAEGEYLCDGMTEEIINSISNIPHLHVAARTSSFAFKGSSDDVRKIGRELGVGMVLEGSLRQLGSRLRISAQLINVATGFQVWSERWDRELADVFAVQDEIAQAIAIAFKLRLAHENEVPATGRPQNVDAYDRYLKGRYLLARRQTGRAIEELQSAAETDPDFADVHTALADAWAIHGFYSGVSTWEAWARARAAIDEADRVAPESASVALSRAILEHYYGWNTAREQTFCRQAIERNPKSAQGWNWLGLCLGLIGRSKEAIECTDRGIELEPYDANVRTSSSWASAAIGDFETAERVLSRTLEIAPDSGYALWSYATALRFLGRYDESIAVFDKLVESTNHEVPFYLARLGAALAEAGERSRAEAILQELQSRRDRNVFVASRDLATLLTALGEEELALDALELAVQERNALMWSWVHQAEYRRLRTNPRWSMLARQVGRSAPMMIDA